MKKPLILGILAGSFVTAGAIWVIHNSHQLGIATNEVTLNAEIPRDFVKAPLVSLSSRFDKNFAGAEDLLNRRAHGLFPYIAAEDWEKKISEAGFPTSLKATRGCTNHSVQTGVGIRPEQAWGITERRSNVLLVPKNIARCFIVNQKLFLFSEGLVSSKVAYDLRATVLIEHLVELPAQTNISMPIFNAIGIAPADTSYVAYGGTSSPNASTPIILIHFSLLGDRPALDPYSIPAFMAGAEGIAPKELNSRIQEINSPITPVVFLDVRPHEKKGLPALKGALPFPASYSTPESSKFYLEMPLALTSTVHFNERQVPTNKNSRIILYGENAGDAGVFWAARKLRLLGFQNIYYIAGGLSALKAEVPNFHI